MHRPRGGRKYVLLVTKTTHVFARRSGNFELFWLKKRHVVHRGGKFVLLVNQNTHVFARGGGNFELSSCKHERMFQRAWQVCFVS